MFALLISFLFNWIAPKPPRSHESEISQNGSASNRDIARGACRCTIYLKPLKIAEEGWHKRVTSKLVFARFGEICPARGKTMDERIETFIQDVLELEGVSASAIIDGVRSYLAVYENLVRDTEPDVQRREAAARDWRRRCRERVAEEVAKHDGTPMGEHWKVVLGVIIASANPSRA